MGRFVISHRWTCRLLSLVLWIGFDPLNSGALQEENRARDLFNGLWIPDLFMKRVQENGTWSLFCPNEAPGLADCWGEAFEKLYVQYESEVFILH